MLTFSINIKEVFNINVACLVVVYLHAVLSKLKLVAYNITKRMVQEFTTTLPFFIYRTCLWNCSPTVHFW